MKVLKFLRIKEHNKVSTNIVKRTVLIIIFLIALEVHPKTCTSFSGFSVVLKDISHSNCSLSTSFSQ